MSDKTRPEPSFSVNDMVVVIGPSKDSGRAGTVRDVYEFSGMYRYVVEFPDGSNGVFFGFELMQSSSTPT
jgi:hypothetical protein